MIKVEKHGILLSATSQQFENESVFNPGIFQDGNQVHIFYRAVEKGNFSTIGYALAEGPCKIVKRNEEPIIAREFEYEKHGLEDPRIVKIEDTFYLTYTAYDGINAMGALATSKDLLHFEKYGIITPQINYEQYENLMCSGNNATLNPKYHHFYHLFAKIGVVSDEFRLLRDKDVVLFPRKINGKFAMLHRIWPGIQIVYFEDWSELNLSFWERYFTDFSSHIVLDPKGKFEINYIGAGCAPIETPDGWLLIYHGVQENVDGRTYHAMAALLYLDKPEIELSRLPYPLFSPTKVWELRGTVNNVVFPTGTALFGNDLYIYYGAADHHTAVAKVKLDELISALKKQP